MYFYWNAQNSITRFNIKQHSTYHNERDFDTE